MRPIFNTNTAECIDTVIESSRYAIDSFLGRGCWGAVYAAYDSLMDEDVAIKILDPVPLALEQMKIRNLDPFKVVKKDGAKLAACSNVVPRNVELDNNGKPFIKMPLYKRFLSDILDTEFGPHYPNMQLPQKKILDCLRDIANGLTEVHTLLKRAHGDIKPDNIAIDDTGKALLNDFGSSTCASMGMSMSPRDNIGFLYTRAPECFLEDSHPTKRSDVWSFGSLMYRMFTGKYIFEDELNNAKDPELYFSQLDTDIADKIIKKKIKNNIPKKFRKFLYRCLAYNEYKRHFSSDMMKAEFEDILDNMNTWKMLKNHAKKWGLSLGLPAVLVGACVYGAVVHEPTKLTMPHREVSANVYSPFNLDARPIEFTREIGLDLIDIPTHMEAKESMIRNMTDNRYVAYLSKTYLDSALRIGGYGSTLTPHMQKVIGSYYSQYGGFGLRQGFYGHVCISVEDALAKYANNIRDNPADLPAKNLIDLEDLCVMARHGREKLLEAKLAAGSEHFKDYIAAKNKYGKYIISESDQKFLKLWLGLIHTT